MSGGAKAGHQDLGVVITLTHSRPESHGIEVIAAGGQTGRQVVLEIEGLSSSSGVEPQAVTELEETSIPTHASQAEGDELLVGVVDGLVVHLHGREELEAEKVVDWLHCGD